MKAILAAPWTSQGVSAWVLTVYLLTSGWASTSYAGADAPEGESSAITGNGERPIKARPQPKVDWSPADQALRKAMAGDPSFSSDALRREMKAADPSFPIATWADITQAGAVAAWKRFLERSDLTKEQQVFAWWRIGSLYAYNFDQSRGEKADFEQAERAMERVRQIIPGLVSIETLNSATVFAGIPGPPVDRSRRLSEAFNWMATLSDKDVDNSVSRVSRAGHVIDERHTPGGGKPNQTLEERKQFLRKLLADYRQTLARRITEEIEYSDEPAAIGKLLKAIEGTADPQIKEKWQEMSRKLSANVPEAEAPDWPRRHVIIVLNVAIIVIVLAYLVIRRRMRRRTV